METMKQLTLQEYEEYINATKEFETTAQHVREYGYSMKTGEKLNVNEMETLFKKNGWKYTWDGLESELRRLSRPPLFVKLDQDTYEKIEGYVDLNKKTITNITLNNVVWEYVNVDCKNGEIIDIKKMKSKIKRTFRFIFVNLYHMNHSDLVTFDNNNNFIKNMNFYDSIGKLEEKFVNSLKNIGRDDVVENAVDLMVEVMQYSTKKPVTRKYFNKVTEKMTDNEKMDLLIELGHRHIKVEKTIRGICNVYYQ